jgi:ABC-type multidrug transport system ATPase subunit
MAAAIEIKKLEKRYGDQIAVAPMDLTIMQGELFGLLGSMARERQPRCACSPA